MSKLKGVPTPVGERMVEVSIRFWTNNIADQKGSIVPKHVWSAGVVGLYKNDAHGIKAIGKPLPFHSVAEIGPAVEKLMVKHGIKMHPGKRMQKLIA